jgi:hypothetical protein
MKLGDVCETGEWARDYSSKFVPHMTVCDLVLQNHPIRNICQKTNNERN